jgi:methionyl-tRNA formyltransferase
MKIVFLGSDNFALPALKALLAKGYQISCVITQPDRAKGRGLQLEGTSVKALASDAGLKIYQPQKINAKDAVSFLKDLNPDLLIVIAYGQILSQEVLAIPKIFALNLHASLLPKYRGAAPINWALIKGERATGVTVMKMTEEMDAGPIILQKEIDIADDDTAITLGEKLSDLGAKALLESLQQIEAKTYRLLPQDKKQASFAPKLKKADGCIDWAKPAGDILNLIRGCIDWPGAFAYYHGKLLKIYKVGVCPFARLPVTPLAGEIISISKEGIVVATEKSNLIIEELQIEGKRKMTAGEFIAGHKISVGERFGNKK